MKLAQIYFNLILRALSIGLVFLVLALLISLLYSPKTDAVAGINRTINFQGKLVNNPLKTNVSDTSYTVVFTIYDRASGGTVLWQETQNVTTYDGIFRVNLGSVTPIPANFNFNWDGLYLGMKVNSDSEMTPRVQLAAVPYAFNAEKVSGLTVQDTSGNASTSGTLQIPNAKTINLGTQNLTFTTSGDTTLTLPTTGTLVTLAGNEQLTNKTIGNTGLTFSGAATDVTTATDEDFTLTPNGIGNLVFTSDFNSGVIIGSAIANEFSLLVRSGIGNNATLAVDNLNLGDLFTASASGITKFSIANDGSLIGNNSTWNIQATGSAHMTAWEGGGLAENCNTTLDKIVWNSATKQFECSTEDISTNGADAKYSVANISNSIQNLTATPLFLATVSVTPDTTSGDIIVRAFVGTGSRQAGDQTVTVEIRAGNGGNCNGSVLSTGTIYVISASGANGPTAYATYIEVNPGVVSKSYDICASSNGATGSSATGGMVTAEVIDSGSAVIIGDSPFQEITASGIIAPYNSTLDFLVGGQSTVSAKFGILNIANSASPIASLSATTASNGNGAGLVLDSGTSSLQSLLRNTLTLGGSTTGSIQFNPGGLTSPSFFLKSNGDIGVGTNNTNPLASLDIRPNTVNGGGTLAIASISGTTSFASLLVDQRGLGDIFTASTGGVPRFSITNTGGIKLGELQGVLGECLKSGGSGAGVNWGACDGGAAGTWILDSLTGTHTPTNNTADLLIGGPATSSAKFKITGLSGPLSNLSVGIGALSSSMGLLNIEGAFTGKALTILNQLGNQDIFTASSSGTPRFALGASGEIKVGPSGNLSAGTNGQCLISSGNGLSVGWGGCMSGGTGQWWQLNSALGTLVTANQTLDVLFGGTNGATSSATLKITGNTSRQGTLPVASIAARTSFAALVVNNSGRGDIFTASASGRSIFTINQDAVQIGTGSAGAYNPVLLKLDKKINGGDPTNGTNGAMYYNESSGKFRCYENGAWTDCVGSNSVTVTSFTSTADWTKSNYAGLKFTQVITTAGGGGGGGADGDGTNEGGGGGGGAGGTAIEIIAASALGATETVTVTTTGGGGGAAAGGGTGTGGGNVSFGSHNSANGGSGGPGVNSTGTCLAADVAVGGAGGTATGGDVNLTGGSGGVTGACIAEEVVGGAGASSYWGGGGTGGEASATTAVAGTNGGAYGSGGGGAADVDNTTGAAGGAGVDGIVVTMNYKSSGGDLAEWYDTKDGVEMGDVVSISPDFTEYDAKLGLQRTSVLQKAKSGDSVVGVISSVPNDIIGGDLLEGAKRPRPVALAGRVPVKVTEDNGKIKAGDLLTSSKTPGVAQLSTKAGVTIGRALEDSNCQEGLECTVLTIVNTSYSTGALTKVALRDSGVLMDTIPGGINVGRDISNATLAYLIQEKENIIDEENISEVYTDRIIASLEIISPSVVTDNLFLNTLEPVEEDISVILNKNGKLNIGSSSESAGIVFDGEGNGSFSGNLSALEIETPTLKVDSLHAKKIIVDEIEGLSEFDTRLAMLEEKVATLSANTVFDKSLAVEVEYATISSRLTENEKRIEQQNKLMQLISDQLASSSANSASKESELVSSESFADSLRAKGSALIEGVLTVVDSIITNNFIANGLSTFFGDVVFKSNVAYEAPVMFSNDIGGIAIIKKDSDKVEVVFGKEFDETPVLNASVSFDEKRDEQGNIIQSDDLKKEYFAKEYQFIIIDKSKNGFVIVLNKKADSDISFTWTAIRVKNSKTFQSRLND